MAAPLLHKLKISWTRFCDTQKTLILLKMKFGHQDIQCSKEIDFSLVYSKVKSNRIQVTSSVNALTFSFILQENRSRRAVLSTPGSHNVKFAALNL